MIKRSAALFVAALLAPACLPAAAGAAVEPTSTAAEAPALADAQARLEAFVPPPGAQRVASLPAGVHTPPVGELDGGPNLLDVEGYWVDSEPVEAVRAYLVGYAPAEAKLLMSMGASGPGFFVYYWESDLPEIASSRDLQVAFSGTPENGTAITVHAEADWIEPRLASSDIPTAAHFLEVTETHNGKTHTAYIAKRRAVASVVALADSLPIAQRTDPIGCPALPTDPAILRTVFRRAATGPVLAELLQKAPEGACTSIGLTVRGQEQRGLTGGDELARRLRLLLRRPLQTPGR